jgi:hypothetical protein
MTVTQPGCNKNCTGMAPTVNRPKVEFKFMATILTGFTVVGICHFWKTGHCIGSVFCFLSCEEVQKCLLIFHFIGCSSKSY